MKTEILNATNVDELNRAAELLKEGNLVAIPTETVYGLAANANNPTAVNKIFTAKQRPNDHPLIVHIQSVVDLSKWAINIPEKAYLLASAFWPGPLTLVLEKAPWVASEVTGGHNKIALRAPAHPVMQKILALTGLGLAAPSANRYQKISTTTAQYVYEELDGKIDAILDGGNCTVGIESTILDLTESQPRILRIGPLTAEAIEQVLSEKIAVPSNHTVPIPGNKKIHYQPNTPLFIMSAQEIKNNLPSSTNKIGIICYTPLLALEINAIAQDKTHPHCITVHQLPQEKSGYATLMYKTLHELDAKNLDSIWLENPPQTNEWLDIHDRLGRAASRKS